MYYCCPSTLSKRVPGINNIEPCYCTSISHYDELQHGVVTSYYTVATVTVGNESPLATDVINESVIIIRRDLQPVAPVVMLVISNHFDVIGREVESRGSRTNCDFPSQNK